MNLSLALEDWLLPAASKPTERVGPPQVTVPAQVYPLRSGGCVMISAQVRGALPMAYQWHKDGVPLAGATSPTLSLVRLTVADAGVYQLVARNPEGTGCGPEVQVLVAADGAAAKGPEPLQVPKAREVRPLSGAPPAGAPSASSEPEALPAREVRETRQSHPPIRENGALRFEVMDRFDWLCLEGRPGHGIRLHHGGPAGGRTLRIRLAEFYSLRRQAGDAVGLQRTWPPEPSPRASRTVTVGLGNLGWGQRRF